MHHDGALSRGATTTNKIHQHAIDDVVDLLALRLESVVINTFRFLLFLPILNSEVSWPEHKCK